MSCGTEGSPGRVEVFAKRLVGCGMKRGPKRSDPQAAVSEALAAGFEPVEDFPGWLSHPWRMRCIECRTERTISVCAMRSGVRCGHRARNRMERYRAVAADAGFSELEKPPSSRHLPWRVSCVKCGRKQRWPLTKMRDGRAMCICVSHARAAEELQAAGYRPKVTYPGTARDPWPSVCSVCGQDRRPSLSTIRAGIRCLHQTPEDRRGGGGTLSA